MRGYIRDHTDPTEKHSEINRNNTHSFVIQTLHGSFTHCVTAWTEKKAGEDRHLNKGIMKSDINLVRGLQRVVCTIYQTHTGLDFNMCQDDSFLNNIKMSTMKIIKRFITSPWSFKYFAIFCLRPVFDMCMNILQVFSTPKVEYVINKKNVFSTYVC